MKFYSHLEMKTGEQPEKYKENELLDDLADKNGLAIVLTDENSPALVKSNNNSMCEMLYNSSEFAAHCDKFCGRAFEWAIKADDAVHYQCYAGLNCVAIPMKRKEKQLVAIVGRAFTKAEEYRQATNRAIEGDWKQFPIKEFFNNLLLSNSNEHLEKLARKVEKISQSQAVPLLDEKTAAAEIQQPPKEENETAEKPELSPEISRQKSRHWRSLFGSLLEMTYRQAYILTLQFVAEHYSIENLAWLERKDDNLEVVYATGNLKEHEIQIGIPADDERLHDALKNEKALELRERQDETTTAEPQTVWLFPVAINDEIQSALVVGGEIGEKEKSIARFCRKIASNLEILRLREQLERRGLLERAVNQFNESLKKIDSEDFWTHLTNISAELLNAERSSLLVFDEKADNFIAKAATGIKSDFIRNKRAQLGERVSRNVLKGGVAVVVEDVNKIGLRSAPEDWRYKSDSFISYPITIGERKIGVLNLTDRADGEPYNELDLEILHSIMPQFAVLIDRADLKNKASEFEQLSFTDGLTGLPNLSYLEDRLTEEIKRSSRYRTAMSFLMIDVDEFKSYNDNFGHAEGNKALQIVGICLKESLRDTDFAARFGGEEFSIILPQTATAEAADIAERVRERIEKESFPNRPVTVSIGVASVSKSLNNKDALIEAADEALYEAKRIGRNNVQVYENLPKD